MILVAGGTGRLGRLVAAGLMASGRPVRVLTRNPAAATDLADLGVEIVHGDVRDPASLAVAVRGVELVVSAVQGFAGRGHVSPASVDRDGNAHLIDAARSVGAELVLMSVVGAADNSPMELFRMKHAAERHLQASGVPATVIRSSAFMELWLELLEHTAGRSGRSLVFGRGDNPVNFVSVTDVAALVERVVSDPSSRGCTLEIGGPENLTMNQLANAVQQAGARSAPPRHVPPRLLRVAAETVGRANPAIGRQLRASLVMDSCDLSAPPGSARTRYLDLPATTLAAVLAQPSPSCT